MWIRLGEEGLVLAERVVAVGRVDSAPIRRLLHATPKERVLNLTYGYKRRSVLLLDSGHVVVARESVAEVRRALARAREETREA